MSSQENVRRFVSSISLTDKTDSRYNSKQQQKESITLHMTTLTPWSDIVSSATTYLSTTDPIIADAILRVGPCTLMPNPNIFETLVDAIISQQISVKAADAIVARLRAATAT